MIELLRQNEVHVAAPIFESTNRLYNEFSFFNLIDYPGSEYITGEHETDKVKRVLHEVLKSWPLFAVTLILTAIAGVIMWALVCLILCKLISIKSYKWKCIYRSTVQVIFENFPSLKAQMFIKKGNFISLCGSILSKVHIS